MSAAQHYCDKNNYALFVVTEYYDPEATEPQNTAALPMFSVNHEYYKTDYCNKYMKLFTRELTKNGQTKENDYYRFYVFRKGAFVGKKERLFDQ